MNETTAYSEKWTYLHERVANLKKENEKLNFANTEQANTIQKLDYKLKRYEGALRIIHARFPEIDAIQQLINENR